MKKGSTCFWKWYARVPFHKQTFMLPGLPEKHLDWNIYSLQGELSSLKLTFSHPKIDGLKYFIDSKGPIRLAGAGDIRSRFLRAGLCQIYVQSLFIYMFSTNTTDGISCPWLPVTLGTVFCFLFTCCDVVIFRPGCKWSRHSNRSQMMACNLVSLGICQGSSFFLRHEKLGNQTLQMYG